jgi:hypothetical protein
MKNLDLLRVMETYENYETIFGEASEANLFGKIGKLVHKGMIKTATAKGNISTTYDRDLAAGYKGNALRLVALAEKMDEYGRYANGEDKKKTKEIQKAAEKAKRIQKTAKRHLKITHEAKQWTLDGVKLSGEWRTPRSELAPLVKQVQDILTKTRSIGTSNKFFAKSPDTEDTSAANTPYARYIVYMYWAAVTLNKEIIPQMQRDYR